ncbi:MULTISPECIES: helix-turn-helix domain-containing protein [Lactobacillus]|uniref:Rgg/GadR/MutR family transcriptional regulator n=1 Tax=Lactobacillus xujianguonis TaxID=2495899 RepID=A0A437SW53_9LACO|nr:MULTISPECIES: Rgg/GadR/MutR family transcriptional regulator [Lactobacillus]RVU71149.1 Rgg/GadR/MutR family transcriptional regulator [Lactobacillus xujianguonis]RVU77496.1 Rgg/GadR/MutR family transcriptional regulator [Lactobacillus xujianguonis]
MTIGEALKEEREKLGLSRYQFSKGIVDRKFYGKVEKNEGTLSSEKLIQFIFKYQLNLDNFFNKLKSQAMSDASLLSQMMQEAFNDKDVGRCHKIKDKILTLKGEQLLKLRAIVAVAYLENKLDQLDKGIKKEIFDKLYQKENFSMDLSAVRLFSNTMPALTTEQLHYLILPFLRNIKSKKYITELNEERIAIIFNNYLAICCERQIDDFTVDDVMEYLLKIEDIHLLVYKEIGIFFTSLIRHDYQKAKEIKHDLTKWNYTKLAKSLEKWCQ